MLKKILLSTLCALSSIAIAQINLDLDLTIAFDEHTIQREAHITVEENKVASVEFNDIDGLVINLISQVIDGKVLIQTQLSEKRDNEITPVTDWLPVELSFDQSATVTVKDDEEDDNATLTLIITPSQVTEENSTAE